MKYTKKYFDSHTPSYSIGRFDIVLDWLKSIKSAKTILDVGCGNGSFLKQVSKTRRTIKLYGSDESSSYLRIAKKNVDADFILDDIISTKIKKKFDTITAIALLHHLIGKTRKDSKNLTKKTLQNCSNMLNDGGCIIIMEPVFSNRFLMDIIFYIKKFFTIISAKRITIFGYWNNLGAPVVSYFSKESISQLVVESGLEIIKSKYIVYKPKKIFKLLCTQRGDLYLMVKKKTIS